MKSMAEAQPESMIAQKGAGPGLAEVEVRPGPAARALARSLADGDHNGATAQMLAEVFPSATTIRCGPLPDLAGAKAVSRHDHRIANRGNIRFKLWCAEGCKQPTVGYPAHDGEQTCPIPEPTLGRN